MNRQHEFVDMREIEQRKSKSFDTARARQRIPRDHAERLKAAYALLGKPAPVINNVAAIREAAAPLAAHYSSEAAAARLAAAALEPDVDLTALVSKAIEEHAAALAWDSLNLKLSQSGANVEAQRYNEARVAALHELEPLARKTIGDLKRATKKLEAVDNVFDAQQVVDAEADTAAVHAIRRALEMLGLIARLDLTSEDNLPGLLRIVDIPTVTEYHNPTAKTVRELTRIHERMFDYDRLLVDVARRRHEGLTLSFTADDAEVKARRQRLDDILAMPAPPFRDPIARARAAQRRREGIGPVN